MKSTLHVHTKFVIDRVDPRVFGGFLEHLGRAVYEGVYEPKSKHADEFGCRKDVLAALRRLRFTAMRYPGGNYVSGFHWQDAVGPKKNRPTVRDLAWQSIEPNEFGPDEFVQLCRRMDWTPMMAVNLGTGTPEEARNWLEYCNIDKGSKFAEMRRANGYEQPHDIKLWCLGNEMDGAWQIGHVPAENYAITAQQTALMMRMVDPSVELVACGSCAIDLPTYLEWDRKVLEHCRDAIDYISLHRYVGNDDNDTPNFLACLNSVDSQIEATAALCAAVQAQRKTRKRIGISFDEWNVWYRARSGEHVDGRGKFAPHLLEEVYNLEDALVAAGFLNSFIRHADSVKIANLAQIVNVIAPILTVGDQMVLQSIFHPIEMIAKRGNGNALRVAVDGPTYDTKKFGKAQTLDASSIVDGNALSVFLVNRSMTEAMDVDVRVGDADIKKLMKAEVVAGTDPKAFNSVEKPEAVTQKAFSECTIKDGVATLKLPALSVVAATFELGA
ncbi:MAG: alpha-L-arabinofuranosidase C-terminal domain-containing protein [Tepidisphaeraceae bacterium]